MSELGFLAGLLIGWFLIGPPVEGIVSQILGGINRSVAGAGGRGGAGGVNVSGASANGVSVPGTAVNGQQLSAQIRSDVQNRLRAQGLVGRISIA